MAKARIVTHIEDCEYAVDIINDLSWIKARLESIKKEYDRTFEESELLLIEENNARIESDNLYNVLLVAISTENEEQIRIAQENYKNAKDNHESIKKRYDNVKKLLTEKIAEINYINMNIPPEEERARIWLADYDTELKTGVEVGIIESPQGERDYFNIQPAWNNGADDPIWDTHALHNHARDGDRVPSISMPPVAILSIKALYAAWQKWLPTYRLATLEEIDKEKGRVVLRFDDSSESPGKSINVITEFNDVEFDYMDCDSAAFENGDQVIVKFSKETTVFEQDVTEKKEIFDTAKREENEAIKEKAKEEQILNDLLEERQNNLAEAGYFGEAKDTQDIITQRKKVSTARLKYSKAAQKRKEAEALYQYYNYLEKNNYPHRVYSWDTPTIIGFKSNPRPCPGGFVFDVQSTANFINPGYYTTKWTGSRYNSRYVKPELERDYKNRGLYSGKNDGALSIECEQNYIDVSKDITQFCYGKTYTFNNALFNLNNPSIIGGTVRKFSGVKYGIIAVKHEDEEEKDVKVDFYKVKLTEEGEENYIHLGGGIIENADKFSGRAVTFNESANICIVFGIKEKFGIKRTLGLRPDYLQPLKTVFYYTPKLYDIFVCTRFDFDENGNVTIIQGESGDVTEYEEIVHIDNYGKYDGYFFDVISSPPFTYNLDTDVPYHHVWTLFPERNITYKYQNTEYNNIKLYYYSQPGNIPKLPFVDYKDRSINGFKVTYLYFNQPDEEYDTFNELYNSALPPGNPTLWGLTPYITGKFDVIATDYTTYDKKGHKYYENKDYFHYKNLIAVAWDKDRIVKTYIENEYIRHTKFDDTINQDHPNTLNRQYIIDSKCYLWHDGSKIDLGRERFGVSGTGKTVRTINPLVSGYTANSEGWNDDSEFTFYFGDKEFNVKGWPKHERQYTYNPIIGSLYSVKTTEYMDLASADGYINTGLPTPITPNVRKLLNNIEVTNFYTYLQGEDSPYIVKPDGSPQYVGENYMRRTPPEYDDDVLESLGPSVSELRLNYIHAIKYNEQIQVKHAKGQRIKLLCFDPKTGNYIGVQRAAILPKEKPEDKDIIKQKLIIRADGITHEFYDDEYLKEIDDYPGGIFIDEYVYSNEFHRIFPADGKNIFVTTKQGYYHDNPPVTEYESDYYGNSMISIREDDEKNLNAQGDFFNYISNDDIQEIVNGTNLKLNIKGLRNISLI